MDTSEPETRPSADATSSPPQVWDVLMVVGVVIVVLIGLAGIGFAMSNASHKSATDNPGTVYLTLKEWSITGTTTAPEGDVTFVVENAGTMEHEMIVLQTDTPADQLAVTDAGDPPVPVTTGANKVDEDTNVGETGAPNLNVGETRTFVITDMAPGHYVLICNLAGHYKNGMRTDFTVTG